MKTIVMSKNNVKNIDEWAGKVIMSCFESRKLDNLEIYSFLDDSWKIGDSDLVKKMWDVAKQNSNFLNEVLATKDFPTDKLKALVEDEYESGDFMSYFEFVLVDLLYKYLYKQQGIIMYITRDDEMYGDDED